MSDTPPPWVPDPAQMARALARLPFLDREIVLLKSRDRLSYGEIGIILGLAPETAGARYAAALAKLRVQLQRGPRSGWRLW